MERFVKGDVVVIPFPFSNLTDYKKRPALVISNPVAGDVLLIQITSKKTSNLCVKLIDKDFSKGSLHIDSFVKINKLFSADINMILHKIGNLNKHKLNEVETKLIQFIKS